MTVAQFWDSTFREIDIAIQAHDENMATLQDIYGGAAMYIRSAWTKAPELRRPPLHVRLRNNDPDDEAAGPLLNTVSLMPNAEGKYDEEAVATMLRGNAAAKRRRKEAAEFRKSLKPGSATAELLAAYARENND